MIQIGCIADDFTGASDWASFFAEKGISTILFNGIPEADIKTEDADVAVIALKTRTEPKEEAVKEDCEDETIYRAGRACALPTQRNGDGG